MINGPIASTTLCILCSTVAFLNDSVHAIFPVIESRRYHVSMLYNLFGPLIGVKDMDKVHGWLTTCMLLTIIAGIWQRSEVWSIITITFMATLQPYYILVAVYMTACNLEGAIYPVIYSGVFGLFGLLWRQIEPNAASFSKYDIPMVMTWHVFISLVVAFFVLRIFENVKKLSASKELEKLKADSLARGECTWPDAKDMPIFQEDFEPYPILVETAETEQDEMVPTKNKTIISLMFLCSALFILGTSYSQIYRELISDAIIHFCVFGITLPLLVIETFLVIYFVRQNRKQEKKMFDNIEGSRSFESESGTQA